MDIRKADDITVSVVREKRPKGLFRYFREHNVIVEKMYQGIYYIEEKVLFPTQMIVTQELDRRNHTWLCALSNNMKKQDIHALLENINVLTETLDKELADSVLEVSIGANKQVVKDLKGDKNMYDALIEIMGPELEERFEKKMEQKFEIRVEKAVEERVEKAIEEKLKKTNRRGKILGAIENLRDFGHSDDEIRTALKKKYNLSEKELQEYF